jgi:beta-lactamase class A
MNYPGVSLSLRMLMELMLQISDNSATDILLDYAGGANAVTNHLRSLGIDGITVSRSCLELISDWLGAGELPTQV